MMRILIEQRAAVPPTDPFVPNLIPWVEEGAYASIQLARQAYLVYRSQLKDGERLRMRLEDHDGEIPGGWRRGSKILDEDIGVNGKANAKGKRISTLLTKRPEWEEKINLKVRIGPSRPQTVKKGKR